LLTGIVVLFYIVSERALITVDMTESGSFSLSPETLEIIDRVQRPIRITGFYSSLLARDREIDDQFFRLYEVETDGMIYREYIDPVEQPAVAESFQAADGDVFVSYINEDGTVDYSSVLFIPDTGSQERDITQAVATLLLDGNFIIYFDTGMGELGPLDGGSRGLSGLNGVLVEFGLLTAPLDLVNLAETGEPIPDNASTIILARPAIDPPQAVIDLLDAYLDDGGSLLILADTQTEFMTGDSPFNSYMWDNFGLRMLDAVVVDSLANRGTELNVMSSVIFDSEISAGIDPENDPTSATQFNIARPIEVNEEPPIPNGRVLMSSPDGASYGETDLETLFESNQFEYEDGVDLRGPLTTVAFAVNSETGTRIMLVGDSDFATNGFLASPQGNAYLLVDGIRWLIDYSSQVEFAPQARITNTPLIFTDRGSLDMIAFITVVLLPGIVLGAGMLVWLRRSRR
jgi:hypothetical protein